jgi:hypothetical protein
MKMKLLSLLMLLAVATTFAQIPSPAGIAVQGDRKGTLITQLELVKRLL